MAYRKYLRFTPELRANALAYVASSGKPILRAAEDLGIDHRTLWKWVNDQKLAVIDPGGQLTVLQRKRIRDLEKENARLRRDLDFTKKADAFFRQLDRDDKNSF